MSTHFLTNFRLNYINKPALVMLFLGIASGLPLLLIASSLGLWLREAGIDKSTVTMFAWAALAYSFKFIWSPLPDCFALPYLSRKFGLRRSWLLFTQVMIILSIILIGSTNPSGNVSTMALFAVMLGFFSATQDIVVDAYRIESAPTNKQPILSAMYVAGYRIGMIISGAGALYLADFFGSSMDFYAYSAWQYTYYIMAFVMIISLITTLIADEPNANYDENAVRKIKHRDHAAKMGLLLLLPLAIFGAYYLIIKFLNDVLGQDIALLQTAVHFIKLYGLLYLALLPLFLLYLYITQPKVNFYAHTDNVQDSQQKNSATLFALFLCLTVLFILVFATMGHYLDLYFIDASPALAFIVQTLRFVMALLISAIAATAIIKTGLVKKALVMQAWVMPILDFFERYGKKAIYLLLLIGVYRISDIVAGNISNLFYQDLGFSKTDIANAVKFVGLIMTILGGFLGGQLALRIKMMHAMTIGAILACATNLLFIALFYHTSLGMMYTAVIFDNLAAGLASSIFVAFLSALVSIRFTAVQYALLSSMMTLIPKVLGGYSGAIVTQTSYAYFFFITFLLGLPVLLLIYLVKKHIKIEQFTLSERA